MTPGLTIKQVADAAGFTPATLRYYEQIGLLPPALRSSAGYRLYDQRTVGRLQFIARAKQLGCSLEEINGLTNAWDGGRCGPLQEQLGDLVGEKIAAARRQIAELTTFVTELERTRIALQRHRGEGECDDACGCISDPAPTAQPVLLTAKRTAESMFGAPA